MKDTLSKTPMLRILFPYIIGILAAFHLNISTAYAICTILLSIMAYVFLLKIKSPKLRIGHNYILSIPILATCFSIGIICTNIHRPDDINITLGDSTIANAYILKVSDNDFSTNLHIHVTTAIDSCGNNHEINQKMTAWIEGNDYSITEGDIITFKFNPQSITNLKNPEEFDYAKYMNNKGFSYHVFINDGEYKKIGHENSYLSHSRCMQRKLKNMLLSSQLSPDAKSFYCAILLGDVSLLQDDIKQEFSHAGIAHILALSGLHIGIIALLLNIFLFPLDILGHKKIKLFFTLLATIAYAYITGFSVSVIRATIMIGFVIFSRILYRKNTSLNALFSSALFILLINPHALFDIGFQFSFCSVFFILLLAQKFTVFSPKQKLIHYTSSLVTISAISMLGTVWLTAFYFNYISTLSIISNFLILPLLPIIVGCGIIFLILLIIGFKATLLATALNTSFSFITDISTSINQIPHSHIDNIYISPLALCLIYIALLLLILFIHKHRISYLYAFMAVIAGSFLLDIAETNELPKGGYVIFNSNSNTPVLTFSNSKSLLLLCDEDIDIASFSNSHRNFLAKYNINDIKIDSITHSKNGVFYKMLGDKKAAIISSNEIKDYSFTSRIEVDYLVITNKYYGDIIGLLDCYDPHMIILSGNIYYKKADLLINECKELNLRVHNIRTDGAVYEFFN